MRSQFRNPKAAATKSHIAWWLRGLLLASIALGLLASPAGAAERRPSGKSSGKASASQDLTQLPQYSIDEAAVAEAGIRKLESKYLTLYTNLPQEASVEALPALFDQAVPQWCAYFGVDPRRRSSWRLTGCLMKDKEPFQKVGLLPDRLPEFPHAYSLNDRFWVAEQPSQYYRTHLVMHEGTHCFMFTTLGTCGPPWFMEGLAEMLGTHCVREDGQLALNWMPRSREEVPMWGRIKIVRDGYAAKQAKSLKAILEYGPTAHRETEPYGWCWAAAAFLDRHPRYRDRFHQMLKQVRDPAFTEKFKKSIGKDWDQLAEEWQVYVCDLEYGYDIERNVLDFTPGKPLGEQGAQVEIAADRGWQNTGIRLEADTTYEIRAAGRYQLAEQPQIWWSEPNGVSIRYYRGRPLGVLLAAVRPEKVTGASPLIFPVTIGLGSTLAPKQAGTLYLRINDSAGELHDNAGKLTADVHAVADEPASNSR
jgi:hypothetical protein